MQDEVTQADWRQIASAAGRLGIRYRTNAALMQFLVEIAPYHRHQAERETLARMEWMPIDDCPMWELAIVTDGENVAKAQKAECDYGGFYWSIEPEDALEWEPTLWMPFALPPAPEAGQ